MFQLILTPILSGPGIASLQDLQRSFVGLAIRIGETPGTKITTARPGNNAAREPAPAPPFTQIR